MPRKLLRIVRRRKLEVTDHTLPVAAAYAETQKALKHGDFDLAPFERLLPYLAEQAGVGSDEALDQRLAIAVTRSGRCGSLLARVVRLAAIVEELVLTGTILREEDRAALRLALNEWSGLYI